MLKFELNIADRKTLANRMEELMGIHPYYTRAPLYAYDIGNYTIDRDGNLLVEPENADAELLTTLLNEGLIRGGESIESTDDQPEDTEPTENLADESVAEEEPDGATEDEPDAEESESEEQPEAEEQPEEVPLDLELAFPTSQHNGVSLRNLVNLIYSRGRLISKATGGHFHVETDLVETLRDDSCTYTVANFIEALKSYEAQCGTAMEGLVITEEKVSFTGFPTASDYDHLTAFGHLAILMNQQAISQKRIQAKDVNDENEKYALRTWLLRLGMNGPDFKETRKILMENLSGHAAFRTDEEAQKFLAREKAKRDALKAAKQAAQNSQSCHWGNGRTGCSPADTARLWGGYGADAGGGSVSSQAPNGGRKISETLFHCTDINSENVHYQADKPQKCTRSFCLIFVEYMFFYILAIIRT